jgi:hypothetical protein
MRKVLAVEDLNMSEGGQGSQQRNETVSSSGDGDAEKKRLRALNFLKGNCIRHDGEFTAKMCVFRSLVRTPSVCWLLA